MASNSKTPWERLNRHEKRAIRKIYEKKKKMNPDDAGKEMMRDSFKEYFFK